MTLDDLVAHTRTLSRSDDPLDLLATAARQQRELTDRGEELLDHWVQHARASGCPWTTIGGALGVSKQAAQQRHARTAGGLLGRFRRTLATATEGLFTRFTAGARHAVVAAQEEAGTLRHRHLGTEHLLLGLYADADGSAARTLHAAGLTVDRVREEVQAVLGCGDRTPSGHIPFTPRAKRALEASLRAATELGHSHIETGHVLLGLLTERDGVATQVLRRLGADPEALGETVRDHLG